MEMNEKTASARELLRAEAYTCVFHNGEDVISDRRRGVAPLLALLESGRDVSGYCVADKVVGRAAAFLYVLLGVEELFAEVLSEPAAEVLSQHRVPFFAQKSVPFIQNRTGDGFCPMETATREVSDPAEALVRIKETLARLRAVN